MIVVLTDGRANISLKKSTDPEAAAAADAPRPSAQELKVFFTFIVHELCCYQSLNLLVDGALSEITLQLCKSHDGKSCSKTPHKTCQQNMTIWKNEGRLMYQILNNFLNILVFCRKIFLCTSTKLWNDTCKLMHTRNKTIRKPWLLIHENISVILIFWSLTCNRLSMKDEILEVAGKIYKAGMSLLVIDTENKFVSTGFAKEIARVAQGLFSLDSLIVLWSTKTWTQSHHEVYSLQGNIITCRMPQML